MKITKYQLRPGNVVEFRSELPKGCSTYLVEVFHNTTSAGFIRWADRYDGYRFFPRAAVIFDGQALMAISWMMSRLANG